MHEEARDDERVRFLEHADSYTPRAILGDATLRRAILRRNSSDAPPLLRRSQERGVVAVALHLHADGAAHRPRPPRGAVIRREARPRRPRGVGAAAGAARCAGPRADAGLGRDQQVALHAAEGDPTYTPALLREGFEAMQRRVDADEEGAAAAPPPRLACESNTWWIGSRCAVTTGDGWALCDVETG